jgi:hypothetical protein
MCGILATVGSSASASRITVDASPEIAQAAPARRSRHNHREIRADLECEGEHFIRSPDTENVNYALRRHVSG